MASLSPSIATWPKNCRPSTARDNRAARPAALLTDRRVGPNVLSSGRRRPGSRMQRPGNEFPERLEVLKHRAVRIVIVRRRVVHVRRQPDGIRNAAVLDECQQIGDFIFAAARRTIAQRNRIVADQTDRKVRGDHFPGCARVHQFALEPRKLGCTENLAAVAERIRRAIGPHVDHENIENGPYAILR